MPFKKSWTLEFDRAVTPLRSGVEEGLAADMVRDDEVRKVDRIAVQKRGDLEYLPSKYCPLLSGLTN